VREELVPSKQRSPLETMASGTAHELNNILYPILIYTNMLLDKAEAGSEESSDLNEILDCAHRAENLMSKICMYSGRIDSDKTSCDLVDLVTGVMKSIREKQPQTVRFEAKICDDKMPVFVDAAQVTEILAHLCTNAVEAIGDTGDIKLSLEPAMLEAFECFDGSTLSGEHARLTVTDNGIGMHQATLARIFDPFFTTHTQATGLGLSVVTGLVRCHAGGISVYSKPDVGTSIEIYLPLVEGEIEK
jgi:signal transduction histidine kinase